MGPETVSLLTNIIIAILSSVTTVAGGWFILRGQIFKSSADVKVAEAQVRAAESRIEAETERALAELQIELATAAQSLVQPLRERIQTLDAEVAQLRSFVRAQSQEIIELKRENRQLKQDKITSDKRADALAEELATLKKTLRDTGKLPPD